QDNIDQSLLIAATTLGALALLSCLSLFCYMLLCSTMCKRWRERNDEEKQVNKLKRKYLLSEQSTSCPSESIAHNDDTKLSNSNWKNVNRLRLPSLIRDSLGSVTRTLNNRLELASTTAAIRAPVSSYVVYNITDDKRSSYSRFSSTGSEPIFSHFHPRTRTSTIATDNRTKRQDVPIVSEKKQINDDHTSSLNDIHKPLPEITDFLSDVINVADVCSISETNARQLNSGRISVTRVKRKYVLEEGKKQINI
ncbi:unnamed protein product, partial [Didymodactylos carnosus]